MVKLIWLIFWGLITFAIAFHIEIGTEYFGSHKIHFEPYKIMFIMLGGILIIYIIAKIYVKKSIKNNR